MATDAASFLALMFSELLLLLWLLELASFSVFTARAFSIGSEAGLAAAVSTCLAVAISAGPEELAGFVVTLSVGFESDVLALAPPPWELELLLLLLLLLLPLGLAPSSILTACLGVAVAYAIVSESAGLAAAVSTGFEDSTGLAVTTSIGSAAAAVAWSRGVALDWDVCCACCCPWTCTCCW